MTLFPLSSARALDGSETRCRLPRPLALFAMLAGVAGLFGGVAGAQEAANGSDPFPTVASAVTEVKRLNAIVVGIEAEYERDVAPVRAELNQYYAARLATIEKMAPGKTETPAALRTRMAKAREEVNRQRDEDLLSVNVARLSADATALQRATIKTISEREYSLAAGGLLVELQSYNLQARGLPLLIRIDAATLGIDPALPQAQPISALIPLPPEEAVPFRTRWDARQIRLDARFSIGAGPRGTALVVETDGRRLALEDGVFMTAEQHRERRAMLEQLKRPKMANIPAGCFDMGPNENDIDSETPTHRVCINPFQMGISEVTQAQWRAVMGSNPARFKGCDDCPVETVSWIEVHTFLQTLNAQTSDNYRLPSESEWEYACRGGVINQHCGGDEPDPVAWNIRNSNNKTSPVAQKQPNAFGVYDMSGNVWEWVEDCWSGSHIGAPNDGSVWTKPECIWHPVRGGSWSNGTNLLRANNRISYAPAYRGPSVGFRLAKTP